MADTAPSVSAARRLPPVRLIILAIPIVPLSLAVLSAAAFVLWFRISALTALPQLDGNMIVAGLKSPVTVIRDTTGTPHIRAASLDDLFLAQGYVTAQDRLFQMDLSRRYAAGELSEVLGSPVVRGEAAARLLDQDRQQRYLQVRRAAEWSAAQARADDRRFFEAYARGVNAFIERNRDRLPIELRFLGYQPRPWTPVDSVLVGTNISQMMNSQFPVEWRRDRFAKLLSPRMLDDLYVNDSPRERAPGEGWGAVGETATAIPPTAHDTLLSEPDTMPDLLRAMLRVSAVDVTTRDLAAADFRPASNNWVVSGRYTASGRPMLSNDMHLPHAVPGVWYQAHLVAGDYNVIGYTLPGLPYVIAGHNGQIAWGFTNLGPDVQDLYIESFNSRGEYETPSGWAKPEIRREVIRVKGKPDVVIDVEVTRHGPIITPILKDETRKLALRWIVYEIPQGMPFFELGAARNWQEFRTALSRFVAPAMNVVYADIAGNIGYQAAGRVPIRASGNGLALVPGNDDVHEWVGYIPWEEMPSVFNPPGGILATANSRITPHGYRYFVANQWASPHRTERIYRVLEAKVAEGRKFTTSDMLGLQTDVYSDFDLLLARELVRAVLNATRASERAREAAEILKSWDGHVLANSAAAGLISAARRKMSKLVLQPRLGGDYIYYRWFGATSFWENLMRRRPAEWLPPDICGYDELFVAVVEQTVTDRTMPPDLGEFTYGTRFPLELNHPIFGPIPVLGNDAGPGRVPQRGNGNTVNQAGATFGPSQRLTVDFGDLDRSTSNIVTGQSGQVFSAHYMDQFRIWLQGRTLPLPYSERAVEAAKDHEMTLRPCR